MRLSVIACVSVRTVHRALIGMRTDLATSRAWLAHLDPATGRARVFGMIVGVSADCEVRAGAVICRRLDATIGIWRRDRPETSGDARVPMPEKNTACALSKPGQAPESFRKFVANRT
jgi:hypothetical protein